MIYYPEPGSHIRDKIKLILDLKNYVSKKELEDATGVDTSNLAAENDVITSKTKVGKLDIDKLVNVPSGLSDLESKVDDSDVDKLKTVPIDLEKLSDVVSKKAVKKAKYNELHTNTFESR